jgi:uncharacterized membrane protein
MKKSLLALVFAVATLTPLAAVHAQTVVDLSTTPGTYTPLSLNDIGATSAAGVNGTTGLAAGHTVDYYFTLASGTSGVKLFLSDIQGAASNVSASIVGLGGNPFSVAPGNISSTTFNLSPNTGYTLAVTSAGNTTFGANLVAVSAAPEPATWALMVFGIGAIGVAMRRSRRASAAALAAA